MATPRVTGLADNYDLNTLVAPGEYSVVSPTNGPATGNWYVFVYHANISGLTRTLQVAFSATTGASWVRAEAGGWTDWISSGSSIGASTSGDALGLATDDLRNIALLSETNGFGTRRLQTALVQQHWFNADRVQ